MDVNLEFTTTFSFSFCFDIHFSLLKAIVNIFRNFIDNFVIFLAHIPNQFVSVIYTVQGRVHRLYEFKQSYYGRVIEKSKWA